MSIATEICALQDKIDELRNIVEDLQRKIEILEERLGPDTESWRR